jgi:long-chain acyl-CoA synthetase
MMDYAGRVAQADTYPKLLRLNAREHGGEIALREKDYGACSPGTTTKPGCATSRSA